MAVLALRYEDMLERLGDQGRQAIIDTYQLWQDGYVSRETFLSVSSELLQHINEQATVYGSLSYEQLAAFLADQEINNVAALTHKPQVTTSRSKIQQSLETILVGEPEQILMRLDRLGYVLPIQETQRAYEQSLGADDRVEGWTRGMDDNACQLCVWWWREGRHWPKNHPFQSHNGCKCQQVPVMSTEVTSTVYTRELQRRREAILNRDRRSSVVGQ